MKLLRVLVGAMLALCGCGKMEFEGPGTKQDVDYLREVWGVSLLNGSPTLVKKAEALHVYISQHEQLEPHEKSIARDWKPLPVGTVIKHPGFEFDGSKDTKARYADWLGADGKRRFIVLDYSTAVIGFILEPH
jgi:hypothetical protein